jgi:hypothetical protein
MHSGSSLAISLRSAFVPPVNDLVGTKNGSVRTWFAILLVALLVASVGPVASAAAETFEVDSTGDAPQAAAAVCETEAGDCTLRAAIEAANQRPGRDEITFSEMVFPGGAAGTIEPSALLPAIVEPLVIDDRCPPNEFGDVPPAPCAGIDASGLGDGLVVAADEVTIEGLAVTGAAVGIDVIGSSDEFDSRRDVIGADLLGDAGSNGIGIFLGPGSDDARIGGYVNGFSGRDEIVDNTEVGLDIAGASRAEVSESTFGVSDQTPAPNGKDIEVTDLMSEGSLYKAVENQIGEEAYGPEEPAESCFEICNVIGGAVTDGIDLQGDGGDELPASGPTTIRNNFIGTDYSGDHAVANGAVGIDVGGADRVTIGGPRSREANRIVGGLWAVTAGPEARELTIEGNVVGETAENYPRPLEPPSAGGFSVDSSQISYPEAVAWVIGNRIHLYGGIGIEATGKGAQILGNEVYGSGTGIQADGENPWWFGAIYGNYLEYPGAYGIRVESARTRLFGNFVFGAEDAGVRVDSDGAEVPREVTIGGATEVHLEGEEEAAVARREAEAEEEENEIEDSGGPAIEIVGDETAFVGAARNFGAANDGSFIDLGGDGPGNRPDGPDRGVQPPTILSATPEQVSGVTHLEGGGVVGVFLKADSSPGEIEEFLAAGWPEETKEGELWSVELPEYLPPGTQIAVEQTSYDGTSEFSFATIGPGPSGGKQGSEDEEEGEESAAIGGSGEDTGSAGGRLTTRPSAPDRSAKPSSPGCAASCMVAPAAPETRILAGPHGSVTRTRVSFRIAASPPTDRLECSLDDAPFRPCHSPRAYSGLGAGRHSFRVRAISPGGIVDKSPAKRTFRIR